jgi:UDP-N-acetylenolpyruvoylglucosamine reductase
MEFEALEGVGDAAVVGIEIEEQLSLGFLDTAVKGSGLALILLVNVAERKVGFGLPLFEKFPGGVGGAVVDNQPFKIAKSLNVEAFIDAMQGMSDEAVKTVKM